jgi:type IV pilus assembly protein PilY1
MCSTTTCKAFLIALLLLLFCPVAAATNAANAIAVNPYGNIAQGTDYTAYPVLNSSAVAPLVMLAVSRDEQLFIKAYSDYTDLDGDGVIDTTYNNVFSYSGYFDPTLCYQYGGGTFKANATATNHLCAAGTAWSGNFLNWATMSRADVLRFVLYGGFRSTDTAGTGGATILERASIPSDLHAWSKVYTGTTAVPVGSISPYSAPTAITLCNVTPGSGSSGDPLIRVANGVFSEWAATSLNQCNWRENNNITDNPYKASQSLGELTARVQVCDSSASATVRESFCQLYTDNLTWKPVGLLQRYGENGQMRFGLLTGSFSAPRSGGVLRRNIGKIAGNNTGAGDCQAGDEINLTTGTFCLATTSGSEGIINSLNSLRLTQWNGSNDWNDCNTYGILNRSGFGNGNWLNDPGKSGSGSQNCSAWGNPLSEIYAEALRYIAADSGGVTSIFNKSGDLGGLPSPSWTDPYSTNPYCAACSIIVLSTGLNSFDSDEIPTVGPLGTGAESTLTTKVGGLEGINSITPGNYIVGRVGLTPVNTEINTYSDTCTATSVGDLSMVRGICPDIPSMEGSYLMAGLAYGARTTDMRPTLKTPDGNPRPQTCDANGNNCVAYKNIIKTYAVALSENLPKFQIPLSNGSISISPLCQANNSGGAKITDGGWRTCYLGSVGIGPKVSAVDATYVYGRPLSDHGGSFSLVWEDSLWGNDHDNDVVAMITYCVGPFKTNGGCGVNSGTLKNNDGSIYTGNDICWRSSSPICAGSGTPTVAASEVLIRDETLSAFAGNAMLTGYSTAGSNADGAQRLVLRPGSSDNSVISTQKNPPSNWDSPSVVKYSVGSNTAKQLENPLFYAAKYGGFTDVIDSSGKTATAPCDSTTTPSCTVSNWDAVNNTTGAAGSDGVPDTYFPVRNPSQLADRLAQVFNSILARAGSGTAAAVVANTVGGEGVTYSAIYRAQVQNAAATQTVTWAGNLNALWTDADGFLRAAGVGTPPTLGDYNANPIVVYCTDSSGASRFSLFTDPVAARARGLNPADCSGSSATDVPALWSAEKELSDPNISTTTITTQRTYSTAATSTSSRYIFTWLDANNDGNVDTGEQKDFIYGTEGFTGPSGSQSSCTPLTLTTALGTNYRALNTCQPNEAKNLVNWLRGQDSGFTTTAGVNEDAAWRSRTLSEGGVKTKTYRLGDIVNSTPLAVSTPAEAFDQLYNDASYAVFRSAYQSRRQVVYVGANDGMIHAFNGGFYDGANKRLNTQPQLCVSTGCTTNTTYTAHELGAEIWAYVPGNLLPHLRWQSDPAYLHNFYVDGSPTAQDVKIFADDGACAASTANTTSQCHPQGWGTILIVPFRFGGGPVQVPAVDGKLADFQNSFSAYVVLDVTNPEAPPKVLAELSNVALKASGSQSLPKCSGTAAVCATLSNLLPTYTSSAPAVAMFRGRNTTNPTPSKFFLFTGSGTTDNTGITGSSAKGAGGNAVSGSNLVIRGYDMASIGALGAGSATPVRALDYTSVSSTNATNSFAGDLIASDQDLDGLAESLYFGSSKGTGTSGFGGSLWSLDFSEDATPGNWSGREIIPDLNHPLMVRPTLGVNSLNQTNVFFGTGRAWTKTDLQDQSQQLIAGVVDKPPPGASGYQAAYASLKDVTNVVVTVDSTNNTVLSNVTASDGTAITTETQLSNDILKNYKGWRVMLDTKNAAGKVIPAERVISPQALYSGILLTTSYLPGTDSCTDQGTGRLYAANYSTGAANKGVASLLGVVTSGTKSTVNHFAGLGLGLPSSPSLHRGGSTPSNLRACVQTSSGAVLCADVTALQGTTSGEVSWREPIDK